MGFDFSSIEEYVAGHIKVFIFMIIGLIVFVGIVAVSVFFVAVTGEEQTMVPDVVGKELTEALLELQVKELYPRLQLRYSQTSLDKGLILEQEPLPGTIVKAGRRIRLVVSQGVVLNRVENYVSRNIDEVRLELNSINASGGLPLVTIREPIMYEFSSETPGVILAQRPEAGADISGPTSLEFVVSMGRANQNVTVPQLTGLPLDTALNLISSSGINFEFITRERRGDEAGEVVVFQSPEANNTIPQNSTVQITLTQPESLEDNEVFGLFLYTIPPNPYPLEVRLDAALPTGERQRIISVNYPGGNFTVPYKLPAGTVLILSMMNRELYREVVGE